MANSKATRFMVMAAFFAVLLLISTEKAAGAVASGSSLPEFILGRKVLEAKYEAAGRSGYNGHKPTGRGGYNSYGTTGRGGYNSYDTTGRGGYN